MEKTPTAEKATPIQKVFIVINPVSGVKDNEDVRKTIDTFCETNGWDYEVHETKPDEDLTDLVRGMVEQKVDCVVAAGGDGTIASVVSGLVNSNVPLGILPLGTGNNLARGLNIPLTLADALALISSDDHQIQILDLMQVDDEYYVLNVSIGVSADTMQLTGRKEKQKFGVLAYLRRGIESVNNANMQRYHVEVDGMQLTFKASEVMITNDKFMGLQPQLQGVDLQANDGRLDMFIVRADTLIDYLGVFGRFLIPAKQKDDKQLKHIPIHQLVSIKSDPPMVVQADGEVIGETPIDIRVVPDALRVITPRLEK